MITQSYIRQFIMSSCVMMLCFASTFNLQAQHDHEHAHDHSNEAEDTHTEDSGPLESIAEGASAHFELLMKFIPVETTEQLHMMIYLSDFNTNAPLDSALLQLKNEGFAEQPFEVKQIKPGIYEVTTIMPAEKMYDFHIDIQWNGIAEQVELHDVDFQHHHVSVEEEHTHSHTSMYFIGIGLLIAGIVGGFYIGRRRGGKALSILFLLAMIPTVEFNTSLAHEGHNHGPEKKSGELSKGFLVEKETQFLLDIRTVVAGETEFNKGSRLYGTVIPSPEGHAEVIAPQTSKIISIKVKPGDSVQLGQVLAVVERIMEAGNDISFQAEKNRLDAEYEAAKKEYERKKSLQDIASARELEEATSRYEIAKSNRDLFQSGSRNLTLTAPISGIVAPFVLSDRSSVNGGQTLFVINQLSKVFVEAQAYERDIEAIESAKRFHVQCMEDFHTNTDVKLVSLVQEFNASNQSQRVLFEVNNSDGKLKLGEFVNVWTLSEGGLDMLALPEESVTEIEGRPVVFVKNSAERYELRYISTGDRNGNQIVVKDGIKEGERVVSLGSYQTKLIYLNQ